ncbi:MAG: hypothetical protein HF976_04390 [ANME-2 cluster archaeon]|nr:hypothetical protein [ANME-2 cluster archaeon]MBC2700644.1 hypothetical protein [ANME-2 cluster archaeon]MBC2706205.1 hypothetical protein [ANME-2 cluster archaeon]MBC2746738.1 hypothetical protein [ANME-2 cluster archaeon]
MVQEDREYRKVLCRVPEYQQPQPEAQAYLWAKRDLASAPAFQPDNPHLLNRRKAGIDL